MSRSRADLGGTDLQCEVNVSRWSVCSSLTCGLGLSQRWATDKLTCRPALQTRLCQLRPCKQQQKQQQQQLEQQYQHKRQRRQSSKRQIRVCDNIYSTQFKCDLLIQQVVLGVFTYFYRIKDTLMYYILYLPILYFMRIFRQKYLYFNF